MDLGAAYQLLASMFLCLTKLVRDREIQIISTSDSHEHNVIYDYYDYYYYYWSLHLIPAKTKICRLFIVAAVPPARRPRHIGLVVVFHMSTLEKLKIHIII